MKFLLQPADYLLQELSFLEANFVRPDLMKADELVLRRRRAHMQQRSTDRLPNADSNLPQSDPSIDFQIYLLHLVSQRGIHKRDLTHVSALKFCSSSLINIPYSH